LLLYAITAVIYIVERNVYARQNIAIA